MNSRDEYSCKIITDYSPFPSVNPPLSTKPSWRPFGICLTLSLNGQNSRQVPIHFGVPLFLSIYLASQRRMNSQSWGSGSGSTFKMGDLDSDPHSKWGIQTRIHIQNGGSGSSGNLGTYQKISNKLYFLSKYGTRICT